MAAIGAAIVINIGTNIFLGIRYDLFHKPHSAAGCSLDYAVFLLPFLDNRKNMPMWKRPCGSP